MSRRARLLPCLVAALPLVAQADSDPEMDRYFSLSLQELMETEVFISTNTPQTLSKAPSVVSVITADDIKSTGATNLAEVLQSVPGIYVRYNLFGFRPQITFRGATAPHTLLMVDGTPLKDLMWNAGIFWRGLPTSMIERIEVIRGPGSALFGSDASAGTINVITKAAAGIKDSEAGLRVGSFDTQTGWAQHGWSWAGFDFDMTAELSHTDGHDPFIARDAQSTGANGPSYAPGEAAFGWDNEDYRLSIRKGDWSLHTDYTRRRNVEIGLTGAGVLDPTTEGRDSRLNLDLSYDNPKFATDWGLNAQLSYQHLDYSSGNGFQERPPGYIDRNGNLYPDGWINQMRSAERGVGLDISGQYTGFKGHSIRLGGGYSSKDLYSVEHYVNFGNGPTGVPLAVGSPLVDVSDTPSAFAPEMSRQIKYLFIQDVWALADDWELTAGARYDDYSDFGGALVPRVALVWKTTDRLTTKLMYGEAFRAPSYLELYAKTSATQPNPNLQPERSETWDLSFAYLPSKDWKLGLSLYQFKQSDLISDRNPAGQFQNMGDNLARGIELEAMWQATDAVRVSGYFTLRHDSSLPPYNSVPEQMAYLRTDWAFQPHWNWDLEANWFSKHELATGDARAPIDAYTWVDTTVRYTHSKELEFAASIRNLFDVDARELSSRGIPDNLPLPERNFYVEVRYKL